MEHVRNKLAELVAQAANVEVGSVKLEHPEAEEHGDYSTNIALVMKGGKRLAEEIAGKIKPDDLIERVEVAGSGFINIFLKSNVLVNSLIQIASNAEKFGSSEIGKGKTVIIDYSAPNIAKRFSIGHLRSTIIGQTLYNLYSFLGYKVVGDNHLGDWGTQFGKLIYMIKKYGLEEYNVDKLEEIYVEFHKLASDPKLVEEMESGARNWFKRLEEGDKEARGIWQKCVDVSMAEFNRIYDLLRVKIDFAFGESFYEAEMQKMVKEVESGELKGFEHSEGAWVMHLHDMRAPLMFLKSDGATTYATRDLATIRFRMARQDWQPVVKMIYEVGVEQTLHFQQVFAAARGLGFVGDGVELYHTRHGLYLGTDGKKFKTRKGDTVKLEEVLSEAIERAIQLGSSGEETAKAVGIGAIKYFDLMHNIQSDIVFDWEKVMNMEGNSGPYLQYTYARTQSVIAKSKSLGECKSVSEYQSNKEEMAILRWIYRFPEVVEEAAFRHAPNLVCNFLYELAARFNTFYNQHSILNADNKLQVNYRLQITSAVGQVLKNGLELLGIEALERM